MTDAPARTNFAAMSLTTLDAWYKEVVGYSPGLEALQNGEPVPSRDELWTLCAEYEKAWHESLRTTVSRHFTTRHELHTMFRMLDPFQAIEDGYSTACDERSYGDPHTEEEN